jgi:hypothetical protein
VKTVVVLLALALAGGLWWLLEGGPGGGSGEKGQVVTEQLSPELQYLTRGSEAVTLSVRTADGRVPPLAEVGLRYQGTTRWLNADEYGRRLFLGAPVGTIEAVARAPDYEEAVKPLPIVAGLSHEVILVLERKK